MDTPRGGLDQPEMSVSVLAHPVRYALYARLQKARGFCGDSSTRDYVFHGIFAGILPRAITQYAGYLRELPVSVCEKSEIGLDSTAPIPHTGYMSKTITAEQFESVARMAAGQWEDARYIHEDAASWTADEAYAQAIADMRSLLFNYER